MIVTPGWGFMDRGFTALGIGTVLTTMVRDTVRLGTVTGARVGMRIGMGGRCFVIRMVTG